MTPSGESPTVRAQVLWLDEPLSFWGGVDRQTGEIVDRRHPQAGTTVSGRVLVMPSGRGSSSSSSVLADTLRAGTGPAAIVVKEPDPILSIGALVADELYGIWCPVVRSSGTTSFDDLISEPWVEVDRDGRVSVIPPPGEA